MKLEHLNDNDPWMLAEDIPGSDLFFFQIPFSCFVNRFQEQTGRAYQKVLAHFEGYHMWFYFGERDSFEVGQNIVDRIIENPDYGLNINKNIVAIADKLRNWCSTIPVGNLGSLSDEELWKIYDKHYELHHEFYTWVWIGNATDMFHANFTNRLKEYLRSINIPEEKVNEYLVALTSTTVRTPIYEEQRELLRICKEAEDDNEAVKLFKDNDVVEIFELLPKKLQNLIQEHWHKYHYTKFIFVEGEYTIADYVKQIQDIIKTGIPAQKLLADQENNLDLAQAKKAEILSKLVIEEKWLKVLEVFASFMVTKIYRRYVQLYALHTMDKVLKEISKRKYLSLKQVKFMLRGEVKELLLNDVVDSATLAERAKMCVYYTEKNFEQVLTGEEAHKMLSSTNKEIDLDIKELKGEVGCPGVAQGTVRIIIRAEEMKKMNQGDILVSIATDPDIVPAMKKAAAIVTEQGGVTSHAAIVSRELGIPCVIGTKIATKVLKDGDMVEVDANRGVVRKI